MTTLAPSASSLNAAWVTWPGDVGPAGAGELVAAAAEGCAGPAETRLLPFWTAEHPYAPARTAVIAIAVAALLRVLLIVPPVAPEFLEPGIFTVWSSRSIASSLRERASRSADR